jgi:hypothetical protein
MRTQYVITSLSVEPASRLSLDVTGSVDRQAAAPVATGARLIVSSARLEVGGGLSLNANGTYGTREQVVGDRAVSVVTQAGQVGGTFRAGPRWLEGSLGANRGVGLNRTPEGASGGTEMWSGQAMLGSSIGWFAISVGEDRSRARDDILDFGNADVIRDHASIQVQPGRLALSGTWEDALIERGRDLTYSRLWQRTATGSASFRLTRAATLTGSGGAFTSLGYSGDDRTRFWGGALDAAPVPALHVSLWVRRDNITAAQAAIEQQSFAWFGSTEYRLRDFTVTLEYRDTDQDLRAASIVDRYRFRGRQVLFRLSRTLSVPL